LKHRNSTQEIHKPLIGYSLVTYLPTHTAQTVEVLLLRMENDAELNEYDKEWLTVTAFDEQLFWILDLECSAYTNTAYKLRIYTTGPTRFVIKRSEFG